MRGLTPEQLRTVQHERRQQSSAPKADAIQRPEWLTPEWRADPILIPLLLVLNRNDEFGRAAEQGQPFKFAMDRTLAPRVRDQQRKRREC